jgi:hypothetical protein
MAQGILSRFPDLSATVQLSANASNGVVSLNGSLAGLSGAASGSPLGAVVEAIGGLQDKLNIDVSGLTNQVPSALTTIQNAVPKGTIEFVQGIQTAYTDAQGFLQNSEVVKIIGNAPSLQDAALAAIADLLQAFQSHQDELAGKLIDPAVLKSVVDTFTAIQQFQSDFATHQADFLPFLSQNLIGVSHDLLDGAVTQANAGLSVTAHFDPSAVETAIGGLRTAAENAFVELMTTIETFDPADANAYVQIQAQIKAGKTASQALRDALPPFYQALQSAVDSHAWDTIFSTLETALRTITIDAPFSANDVINSIADMLNELLLRIQTLLAPSDLSKRIEAINKSIRDAVGGSVLGEIRSTLQEFLDKVRQAIEAVPTEQVEATVEQMLGRVKQEIDQVNLTQIGATIESKLKDGEQFITDHLNDALKDNVKSALDDLLQNLKNLPIQNIATQLTAAVNQLSSLIKELETKIQGSMDQLNQLLSQLDGLSFTPVSNEVIGEINDIKTRLQAINPNALSDLEKLALKGALALLQGIDLEGKVNKELKDGFHAAGGQLKVLLNDLTAVLETLKKRLDGFQPQQVVGALSDALDKASKLVEQLNGRTLLAPVYQQVDALGKKLDGISPGRILDPLEPPYQAIVSVIQQLDPSRLTAPLNDLYAQINKLIGFVDVTPLLNELDKRQRAMLAAARNGLLNAFDSLHLPEPLAGFLKGLRPVLEAMTDALFSTPDEVLKSLSIDLPKHVKLTSLFEPLDQVFDDLMGMVRSVPADALTTAMETIRQSLGIGLKVIDPGNIIRGFRTAQGLASELSPSILLGMPLSLPSFKLQFQASVEGAPAGHEAAIAATLVEFDVAIQVTDVTTLTAAHRSLATSLARRINALNASGAEGAYGSLRESLDRLLPDFLRQSTPLTYEGVLTGVESLRPSRHAGQLEDLVSMFFQKLTPIQAAIQPAIDGFFQAIRDTVNLLNPLSIKDSVAAIYDTIRQKVQILDPAKLADKLRADVFDPVTAAIKQLDPAQWKERLNAAFDNVVAALTNNVKAILDDIAAAIDGSLQDIRTQIESVVAQIKALFAAVFQGLQDVLQRVEHLVFVDILDRLRKLLDNLEASFGQELDRVRSAFDEMLAAIPLGGSPATASVGA